LAGDEEIARRLDHEKSCSWEPVFEPWPFLRRISCGSSSPSTGGVAPGERSQSAGSCEAADGLLVDG